MVELSALPGRVLDDKYEVQTLLGKGGMGAVFKATHVGTSRTVALKVVVPKIAAGPDFLERFRREATAAGRLRHPNVVDVTDFGVALVDGDEVAYLVMEYLDGCDLGDVLAEEGCLPVEWAVDIVEQVASAIGAAHARGIVHRDLKPQNIWLEPNRRGGYTVKVLDFGIAKLADASADGEAEVDARDVPAARAAGEAAGPVSLAVAQADAAVRPETRVSGTLPPRPLSAASTVEFGRPDPTIADGSAASAPALGSRPTVREGASRQLTHVGAIIGTPHYMSPEQCAGRAVDARSDIYSLGVIAYEMLAGDRPFRGDAASLLRQHVSVEPRDLRVLRPQIPRGAARVVLRALAKDPADRPGSAVAFATALRANAERSRAMLMRSFALSVEHAGTFFRLFLLAFFPFYLAKVLFFAVHAFAPSGPARALLVPLGAAGLFTGFLSAALGRGISAALIAQLLLAPARRIRLRIALGLVRRRLGVFLAAGAAFLLLVVAPLTLFAISAALAFTILGAAAAGQTPGWAPPGGAQPAALAGLGLLALLATAGSGWLAVLCLARVALLPIVVLLEGTGVRDSLRRSVRLSRRVSRTVVAVSLLQVLTFVASNGVSAAVQALPAYLSARAVAHWPLVEFGSNMIALLLDAAFAPIFAIVYAVLYLKARRAGGETLEDFADQPFFEREMPRTRWQSRMLKTPT